jgi:hypothetical protein
LTLVGSLYWLSNNLVLMRRGGYGTH